MVRVDQEDTSPEELNRQARALKDGLRKDVAAWSAARSGVTSSSTDKVGGAPPVQAAASPPRRAKPAETKPVPKRDAPFRMSYGGVTTAEHVAAMLARGAR